MNSENQDPIEAERQRKIRSEQVNILPQVKIPGPIVGPLRKMFNELLEHPESIKEGQPDESWREEMVKQQHLSRIAAIKANWNAPKRHLELQTLDSSGKWGRTFFVLKGKLQRGFLTALAGGRGCGKTQIGVELLKLTAEAERSALYCSAIEFFIDIKATYRKDADRTEKDVIASYRKPSLLVIDDAGRRAETDWEDRMLFELLDKRYDDLSDTLLISNQTTEDFLASIGPSLSSRMEETGGIINCDWASFRTRIPIAA